MSYFIFITETALEFSQKNLAQIEPQTFWN